MAIKADGRALIQHLEGGPSYEINPEELEWDVIGASERGMGPEVLHVASVDHPNLGEVRWVVSEYPTEFVNHVTPEMNGHSLLNSFQFWYDHGPEEGYLDSETHGPIEVSMEDLEQASPERQQEMLVAWFLSRYQDPVHEMPHDGREGGFQFIWGGPYQASDELGNNFSEIVSDEVIESAVDEIEGDGTYDWAPIRYGRPDDDEIPYGPFTIADYNRMVKSGAQVRRDDADILAAKAEVLKNADTLIENLRAALPQYAGMGHNGPPVDEVGDTKRPNFWNELESAASDIRSALDQNEPDLLKLTQRGADLEIKLTIIHQALPSSATDLATKLPEQGSDKQKISDKFGKFSDGFYERLGEHSADRLINLADVVASVGVAFLLNAIVPGLDVLISSVIAYLGLKIS